MRKLIILFFTIILYSCSPSLEEELQDAISEKILQECLTEAWNDYGEIERIYDYFRPVGAVNLEIINSKHFGKFLKNNEIVVYKCSFDLLVATRNEYFNTFNGTASVAKKRGAPFFVLEYSVSEEKSYL